MVARRFVILLIIAWSGSILASTSTANPLCAGKLYEKVKEIYMSPPSFRFNEDQVKMVNESIEKQLQTLKDACSRKSLETNDLTRQMFNECTSQSIRPNGSLDNDLLYRCVNNSEMITTLYDGYTTGHDEIMAEKKCETKDSISNLKRDSKKVEEYIDSGKMNSGPSAVPK